MLDVDFKDKKKADHILKSSEDISSFQDTLLSFNLISKIKDDLQVFSPFSCLLGCSKCRTLKSSSPKLYQSKRNQSAFQFNQDTTHLALNATQGNKRSFKPGYSSYSNATQGHKRWLFIQPLIDLYPITRYDLNMTNFSGLQLL